MYSLEGARDQASRQRKYSKVSLSRSGVYVYQLMEGGGMEDTGVGV
jgi:hypothetical protein